MSGCKSCSTRSPQPLPQPARKAEKLEKGERSDNPRYPHLFVGTQAIYVDDKVQMIVTVVEDQCDDACDCFTLNPQRILKASCKEPKLGKPMCVRQGAGERSWKLSALI
ncbi:MAG: hypothetical protein AB1733_12315 [Thermodesulfobacteriota bacterium]|jgi:hypothetical protein